MCTRGDMLSFAIAFALMGARKLVRGLCQGLTEEERYRVADDVVHQLKQHGDPWRPSRRFAAAWKRTLNAVGAELKSPGDLRSPGLPVLSRPADRSGPTQTYRGIGVREVKKWAADETLANKHRRRNARRTSSSVLIRCYAFRNSSGSLAILAAILRAITDFAKCSL
jgi:hypothetical protein